MKKMIFIISLIMILLLSACTTKGASVKEATEESANGQASSEQESANGQALSEQETETMQPLKLTAKEAYERMSDDTGAVVVDVRTAEEYAEKHITGAILIPNEDIESTPPASLPVLDTEILIYCRSGNRSAKAAQKLVDMGYTNVYDFGGINDWPYETEAGEFEELVKEQTLSSFVSYNLDGLMVDESVFEQYDLTMINIWATFCSPCVSEMPLLAALSEEYSDKGVQIIGIVADITYNADGTFSQEMMETARTIVTQTGADYIHLLPSNDLIYAKLATVSAVPETIFVDSKGNLVGTSYLGSRSKAEWAGIIDATLSEVQ